MAGEEEDQERMLLIKKEYYPNCPGCRVEQYKDLHRGFPLKSFICIWIVVLASGKVFYPNYIYIHIYIFIDLLIINTIQMLTEDSRH